MIFACKDCIASRNESNLIFSFAFSGFCFYFLISSIIEALSLFFHGTPFLIDQFLEGQNYSLSNRPQREISAPLRDSSLVLVSLSKGDKISIYSLPDFQAEAYSFYSIILKSNLSLPHLTLGFLEKQPLLR